ncbi:hypothetical protein H1D32_13955 [Anaerobacillus sp. CMMVII]|uniref:hypothetical protein n=1 Tax=Anaerobacillus sp. CMMVII TaxID=2755588 RepID=UPI0021B749B3|nr:hypothetical protein [Anaerobacillus sp. CMMVII]MCT8138742.1 hypothetical protein [Anaerobacillus sp. CMMVII]
MQITNQASSNPVIAHEKNLEFKQGEIYRATIKERGPENEAILQIRGREIQVKFEGHRPMHDRVTVQINGQLDQYIQVKAIVTAPAASQHAEGSNINQVLRNLGVANPSAELRQATQMILDKDMPLNRESVHNLREFVDKEKGTSEQRLSTVQAVVNKRLEITTSHLRSVHEALNGRPLHEVLTNIAKVHDQNFQINKEQKEIVTVPGRTISEQVLEVREQISANLQEQERNKPSELLKQMQVTVQREANFLNAVSLLQNQIVQDVFARPINEKLNEAIEAAMKLKEEGRELAARELMMQAFTAVEHSVSKLDQAAPKPEVQQYMLNEAFQTQQVSSKDFIVQTITEKLARARGEFKSLQREMMRNLDNIQRLSESFKSQAVPQVKPLLETTIKKLDHAILKSEMMLLTDMKTEKSLMQASSQLAEAKKLLNKGNFQEANKIVQEVKSMIERLEFKPSEVKVKHFISKEEQNLIVRTGSQQIVKQIDELTQRATMQEASARQTFELIRGLGLNRDTEVAQLLASGKHGDGDLNQNMKQALMQLMKQEAEQGRVSQQTSQALLNITGQQLLSKSDTSNLQSMFFNLPLLLQDEVKNLQVFVNSRNEGQQVDWENCSLYFLIETKKLGEVGILVTAIERNLSLTIKNDQPSFKERIEPLAEACKEKLKYVGFNIANLTFTKLHALENKQQESKLDKEITERTTATFTEKGFDYKI